jgi:hypothetical protein
MSIEVEFINAVNKLVDGYRSKTGGTREVSESLRYISTLYDSRYIDCLVMPDLTKEQLSLENEVLRKKVKELQDK